MVILVCHIHYCLLLVWKLQGFLSVCTQWGLPTLQNEQWEKCCCSFATGSQCRKPTQLRVPHVLLLWTAQTNFAVTFVKLSPSFAALPPHPATSQCFLKIRNYFLMSTLDDIVYVVIKNTSNNVTESL